MVPFKPSEIRIIVVLSILALIGAFLTLLQRQGKMARLDLGIFADKSGYNYSYRAKDFPPDTAQNIASAASAATVESTLVDEVVDLNKSGQFDFESLPGIGPVLAARIIAYRDSVGGFTSVEQLRKVKGIGPAKFAAIKDKVVIR